jgi:hypothetical protein
MPLEMLCVTCGNNPFCVNSTQMKTFELEDDLKISTCRLCQLIFFLHHQVIFSGLNAPVSEPSIQPKGLEPLLPRS